MSNAEALKRALRAIATAHKESGSFEDGSMASADIMQWLREALRKEFTQS